MIPFAESGKNVAAGHLAVRCPYCGTADPSMHMGLELKTGYWGCLRNKQHRGKNPARLVVALINCSWQDAFEIVGDRLLTESVSWGELSKRAEHLGDAQKKVAKLFAVRRPAEFKKLRPDGMRGRFWDYLVKKRGFRADDIVELCDRYQLRCCLSGEWRNRLILPFLSGGDWLGWQGRAIYKAELRYISYPDSAAVKNLLFNADAAKRGGRALAVVEGPIDCIKTDFYGHKHGLTTVALLGTSYVRQQIALLLRYGSRFDSVYILTDPAALATAMALQADLSQINPKIVTNPPDAEDPGAYARRQVIELAKRLAV